MSRFLGRVFHTGLEMVYPLGSRARAEPLLAAHAYVKW